MHAVALADPRQARLHELTRRERAPRQQLRRVDDAEVGRVAHAGIISDPVYTALVVAQRSTPPFRADHVGSLLRPRHLLQAREDLAAGRIDAAELRALEDDAIREAVKMQEDVGLRSATEPAPDDSERTGQAAVAADPTNKTRGSSSSTGISQLAIE